MNQKLTLSSTVLNLSANFDDLLESLSTLQQLSDLRADLLEEQQIIKEALLILYRSYKATSCTIYIWPNEQTKQALATTQSLMAIDSKGTIHQRAATRNEFLFIQSTIAEQAMQHCNDCTTLGNEYQCTDHEKSIISVPIKIKNQLIGVITISHSDREHFNSWGYRLMQIFATFLSQQISICRLEKQLHDRNQNR